MTVAYQRRVICIERKLFQIHNYCMVLHVGNNFSVSCSPPTILPSLSKHSLHLYRLEISKSRKVKVFLHTGHKVGTSVIVKTSIYNIPVKAQAKEVHHKREKLILITKNPTFPKNISTTTMGN